MEENLHFIEILTSNKVNQIKNDNGKCIICLNRIYNVKHPFFPSNVTKMDQYDSRHVLLSEIVI